MLTKFEQLFIELQKIIDNPELQSFEVCYAITQTQLFKEFQKLTNTPEVLKSNEFVIYRKFYRILSPLGISYFTDKLNL